MTDEEAGAFGIIAVPTIGLLAICLVHGDGAALPLGSTLAALAVVGLAAVAVRSRRSRASLPATTRAMRRQADQHRGLLPTRRVITRRRRTHLRLLPGGQP